jgi:hypothetical protein
MRIRMYIYDSISVIRVMRNVRQVLKEIKTHFMISNLIAKVVPFVR